MSYSGLIPGSQSQGLNALNALNVPQAKRGHTDTFVAELHAQLNKALSVRDQLEHMNARLLGEGPNGLEVAGKASSVAENAPFTIRAEDVIRRLDAVLAQCLELVQKLSQL